MTIESVINHSLTRIFPPTLPFFAPKLPTQYFPPHSSLSIKQWFIQTHPPSFNHQVFVKDTFIKHRHLDSKRIKTLSIFDSSQNRKPLKLTESGRQWDTFPVKVVLFCILIHLTFLVAALSCFQL